MQSFFCHPVEFPEVNYEFIWWAHARSGQLECELTLTLKALVFPQLTRSGQPIKVLEECIRKCQEDRTSVVTQCLSLDFMPGRLTSATGSSAPTFDHSACYLYFDQSQPDGVEALVEQNNAWHFNEVCLSCELKEKNNLQD